MLLIKIEDGAPVGYPLQELNFRKVFYNTSFPRDLTPEDVEPFGYGLYEFGQEPQPELYKKVEEVAPVQDERGFWMQTFSLVDMTQEEKDAVDVQTAIEKRNERDWRLLKSDWTQVPDAPLTSEQRAAWTEHRAELRDVPAQTGFPHAITWPVAPSE